MDSPTPEQLALAREIGAAFYGDISNAAILRGEADNALVVQAALSAIIETTERAAQLAYRHNRIPGATVFGVGHSLKMGEHLKEIPDAV